MSKRQEITRVARGVLRSVASDVIPQAQHDHVRDLMQASISSRPTAWKDVACHMLAEGCRPSELIDVYIPAVARQLGVDWVADVTGFAQVTLGCARLGALLTWADEMLDELEISPPISHGQVYLMAPVGGQHRLGQQVFMTQLLRRGIAVRLLTEDASVRDADVVMISASGQEDAGTLQAVVNRARRMGRDPFVILGGGAVELARNRCLAARADLVTNDLDIALSECRSLKRPNWRTS